MRCLLDKVTARFIVQGLMKLAEGRTLTVQEISSLDLFALTPSSYLQLFVVPPTKNILNRLAQLPHYTAIIQLFLGRVEVLMPARYFKRWTRRLRDYGFTGEDAAVLALGTFGTNQAGDILGLDVVATFDQPMINQWTGKQAAIQGRLKAMQKDISEPYNQVKLPQVLRPEQIEI